MLVKLLKNIHLIHSDENNYIFNSATRKTHRIKKEEFKYLKHLNYYSKSLETIIDEISKDTDVRDCIIREKLLQVLTYFKDRHFIVTMDDPKPSTLIIEVTKQCNERCKHCLLPAKIKDKGKTLSTELISKTITEFAQMGGERLILTGGEVFLHKDILPIVSLAHSLGIKTLIYSNLVILPEEAIKSFLNYGVTMIQTSIYGPNEKIHDGITGLKGSFQKTVYSLKRLIENGLKVRCIFVLMKDNYSYVSETLEMIKSWGCDVGIETYICPGIDGSKDNIDTSFDLDEFTEAMYELKKYDKELFYKTTRVQNKEDLLEDLKKSDTYQICDGGTDTIYLTSEGKISTCPQMQSFVIGDIYSQPLKEILNSAKCLQIADIERIEFLDCLKCEAYNYCKWCIGIGYSENRDFYKINKKWCEQAFIIKKICEN